MHVKQASNTSAWKLHKNLLPELYTIIQKQATISHVTSCNEDFPVEQVWKQSSLGNFHLHITLHLKKAKTLLIILQIKV